MVLMFSCVNDKILRVLFVGNYGKYLTLISHFFTMKTEKSIKEMHLMYKDYKMEAREK